MIKNSVIFNPYGLAYSDESKYNVGRYRSISLVTIRFVNYDKIREQLIKILHESELDEFKWKKLRGAKYRFCALKIIKYLLAECNNEKLRIDTLIWDTHDKRHRIIGRDDIANLHRMYFHLLKNVLNYRWPINRTWHLFPDKMSQIDWETLGKCINSATSMKKLLNEEDLKLLHKEIKTFRIRKLEPIDSTDEPFIQVADLFAGMSVYSRECYDKYQKWLDISTGQGTIFEDNNSCNSSDYNRCEVINDLCTLCRGREMTLSNDRDQGLKTLNPYDPINFWLYESTYEKDTAPVREKSIL